MRGANEKKTALTRRLRRDSTPAEKKLWRYLRSRSLAGFKFVRQKHIGPYIVDFVTAWHWPQAWESLKGHKAHMIVSASGEIDPRTKTKLLGHLAAAAVETSPSAIGVHWARADVLWPAKALPLMVPARGEDLPLPLRVAVKLSRDVDERTKRPSGTISGMTKGLAAFGLMEIETRGYSRNPQTLNGILLDLASYLIESGPVLKDGDTIGPDEATKIVVRHEQSSFVRELGVYRLYFPQTSHAAHEAGK
jgi:hypothetical protein